MSNTSFFTFLICLVAIAFQNVMAQSANPNKKIDTALDSLWKVYKNTKQNGLEDTTQINILLDISTYYLKKRNDSSHILAEIAIRQSEEKIYFRGTARAVHIIGKYYNQRNNYDSALHFFRASSDLYQEIGDSVTYSLVLNELAGVYYVQGNYQRALESLLIYMGIQQRREDKKAVARALNNLALIYSENHQQEKAVQMHQQAISMREKLGDSVGIAIGYLNIGATYLQQEEYEKASKYLEKGFPIATQIDNKLLCSQYYINSGLSLLYSDSLQNKKNKKLIASYFKKAEKLGEELQDQQVYFYASFGQAEYAYFDNDNAKAEILAKKTLQLGHKLGLRRDIIDVYDLLSRVYQKKNDFRQSAAYLKSQIALSDSLQKEQDKKETKRLQAVFESERQEQIISILREQKKLQASEIARKETWNYSLAAGTVLLFIIMILIFIQKIDRDKKSKQLLEKSVEISQQKEEITQQNQQLKAAFSRLSILSDIGRKITATMDENALISIIKESIEPIMSVDGFGIGVYNPRLQAIEYNNFIENGEVLPFHTESITEETKSLSVQCFLEDKEYFIVDVRKEYFQKYKRDIYLVIGEIPQTAFFVPLRIREHPIGVMTIQSFEKNPYTEDNLALLRNLASYVAISVANANAYKLIHDKNQSILDSMRYAKTIQKVLTPTEKIILKHFSEFCLIYGGKDIVSGDFYWLTHLGRYTFIAVVDCTGHGIPGAFMSMIGNMLLEELINQEKNVQPSKILKLMHERIRKLLKQDKNFKAKNSSKSNKDGMDMILCRIEQKTNRMYEVTYSGAKRPLWYAEPTQNEIQEIGATRSSIGGKQREEVRLFEEDIIWLPAGSSLYLTTDGFADQHSPQGERIGSHNLKLFLNSLLDKDLATQQDLLIDFLEAHRQGAEQRDDITLWGIKLR